MAAAPLAGLGTSALVGCSGDELADMLAETPNPQAVSFPKPGLEPAGFDFPVVLPLPFAHGVASGDPLSDRVIIWTRITLLDSILAELMGPAMVSWAVATDPQMQNVVKTGIQPALEEHDRTVKVDVVGLSPMTTYYYQFSTLGARSIVGRTRTAPAMESSVSEVGSIRAAVIACSSYWSSTWSGFQAIADRNDLDLVIHCGDYIYDFVDEDEQVRARKDIADTAYVDYRDWLDLAEVRRRYALWRSDPALMAAHQQHPWFLTWDNHDISPGFGNELPAEAPRDSICTLQDVCRAFYEWTPTRPVKADGSGEFVLINDGSYPVPPDARYVYRTLPYGKLASFRAVDTQIFLQQREGRDGTKETLLERDGSHIDGAPTILGRQQFGWLADGLKQDQQQGVVWKVINNQSWIAPWLVPGLADLQSILGPLAAVPGIAELAGGLSQVPALAQPVLQLPVRWSTYSVERDALFARLAADGVNGTVFVTGDMHGNWASDCVPTAATALVSARPLPLPLPNPRAGAMEQNPAAGMQQLVTGNLPGINLRNASVAVEFAPTSMGRGGADEVVANAAPGTPFPLQVAASRAIETATLLGNRHVRFMEWVEHGYGIVHLQADRAEFEFWWQDKTRPNSPDVLGQKMVSWAAASPIASLGVPRFPNQIDPAQAHGLPVEPSSGGRAAAPAPAPAADELRPR